MVLVLVIGDLHIPYRCHDLPAKFKKLLVPGKIQQILLTGNVCDRETYDYLKLVAPDVRAVRGDWDENPSFPPSLTLQHGPLKVGVIHGYQAVPLGDSESLAAIARTMDVDVLINGGTHRFEASEYEGRFFVNPGSATGAFMASSSFSAKPPSDATAVSKSTSEPPKPIPSFVLLDIQGHVVVTYVYQLIEGEVKVEKLEVRLNGEPGRVPQRQS